MLFDAVHHAILGMYTRFLYMPEWLDIKWVSLYQNRRTDAKCDCKYKMPDDELYVSEWVHAFWDDMYSNDVVRVHMPVRQRKYNGWDGWVSHNHRKFSFGRKYM